MVKAPVVILISGDGSNLQALIDAAKQDLPVDIKAVISNKPDAYGLTRAKRASIVSHVVDHTDYPDRATFDQALSECIDQYVPEVVILAGFMRILTADFVNHYGGQLINIHPSLLPAYQGCNTHQRVIDAGDKIHGASVHFVTPELDGGPVILQAEVSVNANDNAQTLAERVLKKEHIIYPTVIGWLAEKRLSLNNDKIRLDDKVLEKPLIL